ncbi:hypothetical protein P153DRAFT_365994 [Dothidotthia symphoricarpi CBS 119687]|uniref:Uncharacterized protein n=1 Tax=Dothidotthia symphoricarpi CBS 119687 TaxID=1392245 RepID=A0A6A6AHL7_9PLEO|nr:uncharacterized protein P153DRAFT_365994 [Dothidotthia symphoricarpi CBS 119687]KAF2130397.1 hypothetical protein P153DRAFT_365994 [Dothidotthia symphoricarpi CBS 119687]
MASYALSIAVFGDGEDPNHRSHWGFLTFMPGSSVGNLLQVQLLSLRGLVYQYEYLTGQPLDSQSCEGRVLLGYIDTSKYHQVVKIISEEPAPRNNRDRCQDWILECVIGLEAEELLPPGTSDWIQDIIGKPSKDVATAVGARWTPNRR